MIDFSVLLSSDSVSRKRILSVAVLKVRYDFVFSMGGEEAFCGRRPIEYYFSKSSVLPTRVAVQGDLHLIFEYFTPIDPGNIRRNPLFPYYR